MTTGGSKGSKSKSKGKHRTRRAKEDASSPKSTLRKPPVNVMVPAATNKQDQQLLENKKEFDRRYGLDFPVPILKNSNDLISRTVAKYLDEIVDTLENRYHEKGMRRQLRTGRRNEYLRIHCVSLLLFEFSENSALYSEFCKEVKVFNGDHCNRIRSIRRMSPIDREIYERERRARDAERLRMQQEGNKNGEEDR
ncbi:hypothetical protein PRIPAC_91201 [Pristionchus pacificus]|uniref:Uncharacterized protein n=1 Tax=Pristionchus pacificus TaxID=54126 RepID=A0A2A6BZ41_PRIPA|nr:hypothetical protein PRIPAC_91201 [Pristionchus pacificus]|eukprot:PDM71185.1 hypothetical protein PRIPAC_43568 [Pristionchus pacificus]